MDQRNKMYMGNKPKIKPGGLYPGSGVAPGGQQGRPIAMHNGMGGVKPGGMAPGASRPRPGGAIRPLPGSLLPRPDVTAPGRPSGWFPLLPMLTPEAVASNPLLQALVAQRPQLKPR